MSIFRRRAADPALRAVRDAFARTAGEVDAAQRALLAVIPTSRDEGVPLAQGLAAFGVAVDRVERTMAAWPRDQVVHEWTTCAEAVARARAEAERLRLDPATLGFEDLNARVGDVLHHLEAFADVERALRRRRGLG